MPKQSAGILLFRRSPGGAEVLIVHPGGPFWAKKDTGAWSIPKGEFEEGEDAETAAKREFEEEIGAPAPEGVYLNLGQAKQRSGKIVYGFACENDFNLEQFKSNMFTMEWPPKSGVQQEFPECDRAAWVTLTVAKKKLVSGQVPLLETLAKELGESLDPPTSGKTGKNPPVPPAQASLF
ncbi:MAG TPA: NUDIX domain-containing protein [Candidatus Saccharimonadales bacterium]|nr:NUDIX domain-containing protein [Candidatus Saccharimonadales bacterium]